MLERKEWRVQLTATSQHNYTIEARTVEEAISTAEGLLEDGEFGEVSAPSVEYADAWLRDEEDDLENEDYD